MAQDDPPRRVLVTGATGNVGTALLRRLAAEGVAVSGVARRVPGAAPSGPSGGAISGFPIRWHGIDLAAGWATGALREALEGVDAVVHLAWKIQPSRPGAARDAMRRTNVEGTRAVVTAAREAGVPHLVHASSVGVYAPVPEEAQRSGDKPVVDESWPRTGVESSPYSRDKVAAEDLLDELAGGDLAVARVRPGLVLQREAGSEIARYFGGPLLPAGLVGGLDLGGKRRKLPVMPLPDGFVAPVVHADDLADGVWRVLAARATGAFNAAADEPVGPDDLATHLGAHRRVRVPLGVVRRAAELSWHGRLQPTDPGWVDLAAGAPLQDSSRLKALGWAPRVSATAALADLVSGMRAGADGGTPALAPRRLLSGRWAA